MAVISCRKLGKWSSLRLRPRNTKPSTHSIPRSTSCIPLRIVPRFQPSSRSASRWPPSPKAFTVRAINRRRALPLRSLAVFNSSALTSSVSSISVPPRKLFLEQYTIFWDDLVFGSPLERFARNLKEFNKQLRESMSRLQGQFARLGDTWRDQEHQKFAQEFEQTMRLLH